MRRTAGLTGILLLAACSGGGSGSPTPTPSTPNIAPVFTSAATASVVENAALVYQAAATDAQPVSYTISGGADAARFTISATGALTFLTAPNFEAPTDADGNNVYQVQLSASDGSLSSTLALSVTVIDSREGIAVKRVGTGFNQPTFVAAIPGSSDVYVLEKGGNIYRLTPSTGARSLFLTVADISTDGERGLLGMAMLPDPSNSGRFLVYCTGTNGDIEIRQYFPRPAGSPPMMVKMSIPHPGANNHNGGWMGFGPDGYLYVATGDGGGSGDPANNAQNPYSQLGKILRINVPLDPYAGAAVTFFAPPLSNPYIFGRDGDPYVWALGLRNAFRNSFDGNRLIIADVGQNAVEEINVVNIDQPGLNFGWKFLEGTSPYSGTAPAGLTAPVSQYTHGTGPKQGASIIGGYVYRGPVASLAGQYVFGDYVSGNIWTLPAASLVQGALFPAGNYERRNLDFTPDAGTIDSLVSFGQDSAGNLYLIDIAGEIFMVTAG